MTLPPQAVRRVRIRYTQPVRGRRAAYLVTSALRWRRPLRRAVIEVRVPARWQGVRLSYRPTAEARRGGWRVLRVVRQPFRPDREVVVSWEGEGAGRSPRPCRRIRGSSPPARRR